VLGGEALIDEGNAVRARGEALQELRQARAGG